MLGRLPTVERTWLIEGAADGGGAVAKPLDSLAAEGSAVSDEALAGRRAERVAADLATIIYTSGTTGRPKGCQLTHANMLADVRNAIGALPEIFTLSGRSALLFLPLAHSFARIIQVGCLESGTVLGHTPDVANLVADLGSFQPTFILAVPRVFEKVYNGAELQASAARRRAASSPRRHGRRSSGVRRWASGDGPPRAARACGCGPRTPSTTGSSTASCARPPEGGSSTPCPGARHSANGSGTSSAARVSPCWKATV